MTVPALVAPTAATEPARRSRASVGRPATRPGASPETRRAGFVLYVAADSPLDRPGIDDLARVAETLSKLVREWLPHTRTRAVLSGTGSPSGKVAPFDALEAAHPADGDLEPRPTSGDEFRARLAALPTGRRVVIDLAARQLVVDDETCPLTHQEFDLLRYLALAAGRVVSREELHDQAWRRGGVAPSSRTVDVHVRRLRAKSGIDALITTVRGAGYRLNPVPGLRIVE